jgi:hypothetical protein
MQEIVLHSELSKLSREFVEKNDLSAFRVLTWEKDGDSYLKEGLPSPSSFPSVLLVLPATGGLPESLEIVNDVNNLEAVRNKFNEAKSQGYQIGQPVKKVVGIVEFTQAVLAHPEGLAVLPEMSSAVDLLARFIESKPELLAPYWAVLKERPGFNKTFVEFVEDKAREFNIPIVEK